jgi:hypothetical protein
MIDTVFEYIFNVIAETLVLALGGTTKKEKKQEKK